MTVRPDNLGCRASASVRPERRCGPEQSGSNVKVTKPAVSVALALVLGGSGCGGSTNKTAAPASPKPPASTSASASASPSAIKPSPPAINYGAQYLRLVAPYNAANDRYGRALKAAGCLHSCLRQTIDRAIATSGIVKANQAFDNSILRAQWPASVVPDIQALVRTDAAWITGLQTNPFDPANDALASASTTAANIVRADLHLPPPAA